MKKLLTVLMVVAGLLFCTNSSQAVETFIPHITGGFNNWNDYLQVNNNSSSSATFTITLYAGGVQVYSQEHTIEAFGHDLINLKTLDANAETGIISYTELGLVFRVSYEENTGGGVAEFKTLDTLDPVIGLYFSDFTPIVVSKGSAIANLGADDVDVRLYALGDGTVLDTYDATIPARDKIIAVHTDWFPGIALADLKAIIAYSTSSSLCGIAICGDATSSQLLFTPAIPVSNFEGVESEWSIDCIVNMDGTFTVTADGVFTALGNILTADITTKTIGGMKEVHNAVIEGTISGSTVTFTDQSFSINVGIKETIIVNGTMTPGKTWTTFNASGTIGGSHRGTFTATGTRK